VNASWPDFEDALKSANRDYVDYMYDGANHGFHNDTTPRYDEAAAILAWQRTIEHFSEHLITDS
jgi:carboxymethylenebutenolidase